MVEWRSSPTLSTGSKVGLQRPSRRLTQPARRTALLAPWQSHACVDAAVERTDRDHPALAVVAGHKRHLHQQLSELADAAGISDPDGVAADLLVVYEGTLSALLLGITTDPFGRARRLAEARLASAR